MLKPKLFCELKTYNKKKLWADFIAGITVGVVALPLSIAFSTACGLPPENGLFSAIVAGFIISALGGSKVQIGGPAGALVVIITEVIAKFGYSGLIYSTLIAGLILIAFGIFRFGALIKFIPYPVTTGFTAGIAFIIFSIPISDFFGLSINNLPVNALSKWRVYFHNFSHINPSATALGIATIITIVLIQRFYPKLPSLLLGMAVVTIASTLLGLNVETLGSRFGELPRMLPMPSLPALGNLNLQDLIPYSLTIALLISIISLLSAEVIDGMIEDRHRPNMELIAQGIANMAAVLFGGIPASGAVARSATNVRSGGRTPVAGMIHSVTLLLIIIIFAPLAKLIPLTSLAGILIVVSYHMSQKEHIFSILSAPRSDIMVLVVTFLLTLFAGLTIAVEVGVVLASLLFIRRMSEVSNVGMITRELNGDIDMPDDPNSILKREVPDHVEVFEVRGPFFFGAADRFKDAILMIEKDVAVVILRLRNVPAIDATGLYVLKDFHRRCRRDGACLILSGVHAQPLFALQRSRLYDEIGEENMFGNIDDALNRAREIIGIPTVPRPTPFVPTVAREKDSGSKKDKPKKH